MKSIAARLIMALWAFGLYGSEFAEAHRFAPSLFKVIEAADQRYNVLWKTPTEASSNTALRPTWPAACRALDAGEPVPEGTGMVTRWTLDCAALGEAGLIGQGLGVAGLAENQASAVVILELNDGRHYQSVVTAAQPEFLVPAAPSLGKVMTEYSWLGGAHIWSGIDHLLFVFGLLLLVGFGARLLITITAFTVGHSVTLALVALGFLRYPVALVEFMIALSIFVLALALTDDRANPVETLNAASAPSLFKRYPWWLAGGFGLLHGMGFAGALSDIGLPQNNVPLALLFFNIGIEIGQAIFVLMIFGLGWVLNAISQQSNLLARFNLGKRSRKQEPWRLLLVYGLGGLSVMWCIERGLAVVQ